MLETLHTIHPALPGLSSLVLLLLGALLAHRLGKRYLVRAVHHFAQSTKNVWDKALVAHKVVNRLAQLLPALIIYLGVDLLPGFDGDVGGALLKVTGAYVIVVAALASMGLLNVANQIYESDPARRQRPLKGYVQVLQIVVIIIAGVLMVSWLLGRSPWILLSGLGALTAVLLLVFRETILSLVASVQLSTQDLVRVGDWIEVSNYGADGDVIAVELHTIQVQNWDKTISTIPTHALLGSAFKNWRGMVEAKGRRIKRAVNLDLDSVRFLNDDEVVRFKRFALLKDYVEEKQNELRAYNDSLGDAYLGDIDSSVNMRRLTNIGTFRAYVINYLKHHPDIRAADMTLLVRQLPSGPEGVPIEVYCFTKTTDWVQYERIQGDIFDHLLAIVGEFGLRLYQQPSGADFARMASRP